MAVDGPRQHRVRTHAPGQTDLELPLLDRLRRGGPGEAVPAPSLRAAQQATESRPGRGTPEHGNVGSAAAESEWTASTMFAVTHDLDTPSTQVPLQLLCP